MRPLLPWPWVVAPRGLVMLYLLCLCLLLVRSESTRPSDHGLESEKNPSAASPEMASFFLGSTFSTDVAKPEARNATDPVWSIAAENAAQGGASSEGRNRPLGTVLLKAGLVGGVVGVGLLAAAAFVYAVQARRSKAAAAERRCVGPAPFHIYALEPV